MSRQEDLDKFYDEMDKLKDKLGGERFLSTCTGRDKWPCRGIYFFFEDGEYRDNGKSRVVRVGTHALISGSCASLWNRLSQHRGSVNGKYPGGGNHRGSIFRLHVGTAIIEMDDKLHSSTWSNGSTAKGEIRDKEYHIEKLVSEYIGNMPFLWLSIDDLPGPDSDRGKIERNAIALLSNKSEKIDEQLNDWLGRKAKGKYADKIHGSGLWNVKHVDEEYDPEFLDVLKKYVEEME